MSFRGARTRAFHIALGVMTMGFSSSAGAQAGSTTPSIARVQIANGSFNTADRLVTVGITASGTPTAYRASETKDFSGASWHSFTASPSFTLSSGSGRRIVYVQVGRAPTLPSSGTISKSTTTNVSNLPIGYVITPTVLSNVMADTIVLGLPDLSSTVEMPVTIHDNTAFDFWVIVKNSGQINPPNEIIQLYNSFVTNAISIESYDVTFGLSRLVGEGCKTTDVSTSLCTPAPIPPGGGVQIHIFARVNHAIPAGQTSVRFTLRTRITGVRESNTANNWRDTPITIVK